jgi:hypothetical protein
MLSVSVPIFTLIVEAAPPDAVGDGRSTLVPETPVEPVGTTMVSLDFTPILVSGPVASTVTLLSVAPETTKMPFFNEAIGWPACVAVKEALP